MITVSVEGKQSSGVSTTVEFAVTPDDAPRNLSYPDSFSNIIYTGQPLSLMPNVDGVVTKWAVREPLPEGINIDQDTGSISGVATKPMAEKGITVIAKNDHGICSVQIVVKVVRSPPSDLEYHEGTESTVGYERRGLCGNSAAAFYPA